MDLLDADCLAWDLLEEHGLVDQFWTFRFDDAQRRFGQCSYADKRITASRHLTRLNPESELRDTILHEIAHALVGPGHGHDEVWKAKAIEIGCNGARTHNAETPPAPWIRYCPNCGRSDPAYRRKKKNPSACGKCCKQFADDKYDDRFRLRYKRNPHLQVESFD